MCVCVYIYIYIYTHQAMKSANAFVQARQSNEGEDPAPWLREPAGLKDAAESDEERELVAGLRQKLRLGEDKWYDDAMAGVSQQAGRVRHARERGRREYLQVPSIPAR